MTSCEDLPPELLVRIFQFYIKSEGPRKFLRNVSAVSRRWRTSSANSSLWDEVSLKSLDHNFDHVLKLGERGLLYRTQLLDLSTRSTEVGVSKLQPSNLVELTEYCHKVKRLDISGNYVSTTAMELMAKAWPEMDRLVMEEVSGTDDDLGSNPKRMPLTSEMLNPIFRVWGKNLKYLNLCECSFQCRDELLSKLADCCPSLEEFSFVHHYSDVHSIRFRLPIDKLQRGCPKLRVLRLANCDFVFEDAKKLIGFKEMRNFMILFCNLYGVDISLILNNCADLEEIKIYLSNVTLRNITQIPSTKVKFLTLGKLQKSQKYLEEAVGKWRKTLTDLVIGFYSETDVTHVLKSYLQDNADPKLKMLSIRNGSAQVPFMKIFIQACEELTSIVFVSKNANSLKVLQRFYSELTNRRNDERSYS